MLSSGLPFLTTHSCEKTTKIARRFLDGTCVSDNRETTVYGIYLCVLADGLPFLTARFNRKPTFCWAIRMTRAFEWSTVSNGLLISGTPYDC